MEGQNIKDNTQVDKDNNPNNTASIIAIPKGVHAKKSEKICAAIFLVTGFLNDQEPLKWDIRRIASSLVANTVKLHFGEHLNRKQIVSVCRTNISELSSLLEVASLAGLISSMNASVLAKELHSLLSLVEREENYSQKTSQIKFSKNYFDVSETLMIEAGDNENEYQPTPSNFVPKTIKDNSQFNNLVQPKYKPTEPKLTNVVREYGSVAIKRNKRQSFIIQILKKKKDLTIKDISTIFHDCSEKTIQRELALLVHDGVVVRDGERRWTKYSLALGV
ncbi:MAG: hypothetical protein WA051_00825 [Minisyncoccia bacterium]